MGNERASDDELWARRLAFYGLDPSDAPDGKIVAHEGECIRLDHAEGHDRPEARVKQVPVRSIRDLKRLIGTPDQVVRDHGCHCPELPRESVPIAFESIHDLDAEQQRALQVAADAFLYGDSVRVSHFEGVLDHAYRLDRRAAIAVLLVPDLIVERNATVMLGGNINVALFRRIYIKRGGRLRITKRLKIDCVSIEGESFIKAGVFDRIDASQMLHGAGHG